MSLSVSIFVLYGVIENKNRKEAAKMKGNKTYRKKLTYAGGSLCVLSFIAFILSLCAALIEPVGTMVYNNVFVREIDHLEANSVPSYVYGYGIAAMAAVYSVTVFLTCARAKSKKKLDGAFAGTLITVSLVLGAMSGIMTFSSISAGTLSNALKYGYDNDVFVAALLLAKDALPLISSFLLFIGGLVLAGRLMGEDFAADIPYARKPQMQSGAVPMPAMQDGQPIPQPYIQPDLDQFRKPDNAEPVMAQVDNSRNSKNETAVPDQIQQPQPQQKPFDENAQSAEIAEPETEKAADEADGLLKCPHCGSELKAGAKFCSVCGNRL